MWKRVCGRVRNLPRRRNRRGQSILEYVVIATVIVLAIFAIRTTVSTNVAGIYTNSVAATANAAANVSNLALQTAN